MPSHDDFMSPSRFFSPLIVNEMSLATYCLIVYAITTIPTLALAALFLAMKGTSYPESIGGPDLASFWGSTLVAPIVETFMLLLSVRLIGIATENRWLIAILVALLFSLLHGSIRPVWGLFVFWPFVVLTMSFISWRRKSFWWGYLAACIPHAMNNFTAFLLLSTSQS